MKSKSWCGTSPPHELPTVNLQLSGGAQGEALDWARSRRGLDCRSPDSSLHETLCPDPAVSKALSRYTVLVWCWYRCGAGVIDSLASTARAAAMRRSRARRVDGGTGAVPTESEVLVWCCYQCGADGSKLAGAPVHEGVQPLIPRRDAGAVIDGADVVLVLGRIRSLKLGRSGAAIKTLRYCCGAALRLHGCCRVSSRARYWCGVSRLLALVRYRAEKPICRRGTSVVLVLSLLKHRCGAGRISALVRY
jgi:hypothetical protein